MAAYMVVFATIRDRLAFQDYVDALAPIFERYGARVLTRADPPIRLEGDWPWETAGIVQFDSVDSAKAMWESEDYARVKVLRAGIADFQVILA